MIRAENLDDQEEASLQMLEGLQAKMWTALPGIVVSADLEKQTCVVQPSIRGVIMDENNNATSVQLPLLGDVPICFPRAGGFALTVPLSPGDEVLVVFSSRAIDSWWQSGGIGAPVEARMHSLSDGFAVLAPTSQPKKLNAVQTDGIELRNEARTTYIKLTNDTIFIKGNIVHEGDTEQTGDVVQTGNLTQTGNVSLGGGGGVTANVEANINFIGTLLSNGKNISDSHTHSGVQPGVGNSGAVT